MEQSKTGLFALYNIVSTFPQLVNLISWVALAIAVFFFYSAWLNFNASIRASVGIRQDEHFIRKAASFTIFGILMWNVEWLLALMVRSLGFNRVGSADYLDYTAGDIFQNNVGMSDLLSYVMWICNLIGFITFVVALYKMNSAIVNPQPKAGSRAIMTLVFSLALVRIKEVLWGISWLVRSDSLATWLGYGSGM